MVLWELTLATAYWLGLRKAFRLALKLQRRLVGPQHPRLKDFIHRRTRNVFDVALTVHKEIQKRDLSAGRSLGNFILRLLHRMRPSADIRGTSGTNHSQCLSSSRISEQKSSPAKDASGARSSEYEPGLGTLHDKPFVSQQVFGIDNGKAIRNRISVGIIKPGVCRPNSSPGARSSLWVASRFWGQPVEEESEASFSRPKPNVPVSLGSVQERLKSSFPEIGVFREDIAQWMCRKPVQGDSNL